MIPQIPFTVVMECPVCDAQTHQELQFVSWVVQDQNVFTKAVCHYCKNPQIVVFDEMSYEDLQDQTKEFFHNLN